MPAGWSCHLDWCVRRMRSLGSTCSGVEGHAVFHEKMLHLLKVYGNACSLKMAAAGVFAEIENRSWLAVLLVETQAQTQGGSFVGPRPFDQVSDVEFRFVLIS